MSFSIFQYLQKHFPTAYRHIAPYMVKVYKRNWQSGLQKICEAIESTFGRLKPMQVDSTKFNKDTMHYIGLVAKGKHFSELSGYTFDDVVTKEELTKVYDGKLIFHWLWELMLYFLWKYIQYLVIYYLTMMGHSTLEFLLFTHHLILCCWFSINITCIYFTYFIQFSVLCCNKFLSPHLMTLVVYAELLNKHNHTNEIDFAPQNVYSCPNCLNSLKIKNLYSLN